MTRPEDMYAAYRLLRRMIERGNADFCEDMGDVFLDGFMDCDADDYALMVRLREQVQAKREREASA